MANPRSVGAPGLQFGPFSVGRVPSRGVLGKNDTALSPPVFLVIFH